MLKTLSLFMYLAIFIPIWAIRRLLGISRFERRFHARKSTWDLPLKIKSKYPDV